MTVMLQSLMCRDMNYYETTMVSYRVKLLGRLVNGKYILSEVADLWRYIHGTPCIVVFDIMGV